MVMPTLIGEEAVGSELCNAGPITGACQGSNGKSQRRASIVIL